jgi:hypothetical protein
MIVRNFDVISIKRKVVECLVVEVVHENRSRDSVIINLIGALLLPTIQS